MRNISILAAIDPAERHPRGDPATLSDVAIHPTLEGALEAVREFLGMEVAFASEFVEDQQIFRVLRGDGESFGVHEGFQMPLEQTYCQRVLAGRLPNLMPDVRGDERSAAIPVPEAASVGAFVSVPITFVDGRFYGTLCAASHNPQPSLDYRDLQFLHVFARLVADQIERDQLQDSSRALEQQSASTTALIAALASRDGYTGEHSEEVVALAGAVAERMGLDEAAVAQVRHAALLHDIGKIAIPDAILNKPGPLTDEEREVMRSHPISSERIVQETPGLQHLGSVLRAEHERWDGMGYPDGLAGEAIPLAGRITFVCDAFHAMTSDRPYRNAVPLDAARWEIAAGAGTQFCPASARTLLDVLDRDHHAPVRALVGLPRVDS